MPSQRQGSSFSYIYMYNTATDNIGEEAGEPSTGPQAHSHDDVLGCAEA
jgi:hypothetical protein